MREVILDTETTGMDPFNGDRLVEIGCVELINHLPTGKTWHQYINPERDVPAEATAVHGLTATFLKDKPVFSQVYVEFLDFIAGDALVIHNADFDLKFLNAELASVGHGGLGGRKIVDTLHMARRKFPGSPASLDALCRRFDIDNSGRELHGALLDSRLLADVYLELLGGRQHGLGLIPAAATSQAASRAAASSEKASPLVSVQAAASQSARAPRPFSVSAEEQLLHEALLAELTDPIWKRPD